MLRQLAWATFLFSTVFLAGCGPSSGPSTTSTRSTPMQTLAEKKQFLEKYVAFRRSYEQLDYSITFRNGGDGGLPSPSEWDIQLAATVSPATLNEWISGLKEITDPDTGWVKDIPSAPMDLHSFLWYGDPRRMVGIDRTKAMVLYRNHAF